MRFLKPTTSPPILRYVPPFSAMLPASDWLKLGLDDNRVPPPKKTSPCWAEANWTRNKNAQTDARIANFLKRNLLISFLYCGLRCVCEFVRMLPYCSRLIIISVEERIQLDPGACKDTSRRSRNPSSCMESVF